MSNKITVLVDNDSWILPFAESLVDGLLDMGFETKLARSYEGVQSGWVSFMLGCVKIMPERYLKKNKYNLVVHESDLPKGKGFAPMSWQILEGKNIIPICLMEATKAVDAGKIWLREVIELDGTELNKEWRHIQGVKSIELCMKFVSDYESLIPMKQVGEQSFYKKRNAVDSELNIDIPLKEQLNLLRVVDNANYPAFFYSNG